MDYPKYGDTLKNGAKVLACQPKEVKEGQPREGWVLADYEDQLATWQIVDYGEFWHCQFGDYFAYEKFVMAVADFCSRSGSVSQF